MSDPTNTTVEQIFSKWEEMDLVVLAQVVGLDSVLVTQATISSIEMKVFNNSTGAQIGVTTTLTVSDVIFDTPQFDYGWTGNTGYNFRYTIPGSFFPDGGIDQRIEIIATATGGEKIPIAVLTASIKDLKSL